MFRKTAFGVFGRIQNVEYFGISINLTAKKKRRRIYNKVNYIILNICWKKKNNKI